MLQNHKVSAPISQQAVYQAIISVNAQLVRSRSRQPLIINPTQTAKTLSARLNTTAAYCPPWCFGPALVYWINGQAIHGFNTTDRVVLKVLATQLKRYLPISPCNTWYKGFGGITRAKNNLTHALQQAQHQQAQRAHHPQHAVHLQQNKGAHCYKTDVADFYATINHHLLLDKLAHYVPAQLLQLTQCALRYSYGPDFTTKTIGLPRASSLSPVLANFYLHDLDVKLWRKRKTTFYQRYMDDIIIVCPNKKPLRRAIKTVKSYIAQHKQTLSHPKSTLGRNKHCVYLGQHFNMP